MSATSVWSRGAFTWQRGAGGDSFGPRSTLWPRRFNPFVRTVMIVLPWVVLLSLALVAPSDACTCPPTELQALYRPAVAVFSGRVIRVHKSTERGYNGILATVVVSESWKGAHVGQVVTIATGNGGGGCGVDFKMGTRYLVFARLIARKGWLATSLCSNPRPLTDASAAVDSLRAWKAAGRVPPDPPRHVESARKS